GVSSGIPAGRFVFCDPSVGCDAEQFFDVVPDGVNPAGWDPGDPTSGDFHALDLPGRFTYRPYKQLVTPNERVSIFGKAEYDRTDSVTFRTLISFNNRKSQGRAAPVPLFCGPDGSSTEYMEIVSWPADHPYNPFGID